MGTREAAAPLEPAAPLYRFCCFTTQAMCKRREFLDALAEDFGPVDSGRRRGGEGRGPHRGDGGALGTGCRYPGRGAAVQQSPASPAADGSRLRLPIEDCLLGDAQESPVHGAELVLVGNYLRSLGFSYTTPKITLLAPADDPGRSYHRYGVTSPTEAHTRDGNPGSGLLQFQLQQGGAARHSRRAGLQRGR